MRVTIKYGILFSQKTRGKIYDAKIYRNAAVSYFVSADLAVSENRVLDLFGSALYGGVDIRYRQWDSVCTVHPWDDMSIGAAGDCDNGGSCGSDGAVCVGCDLLRWNSGGFIICRCFLSKFS